jgi:hypothetical protein
VRSGLVVVGPQCVQLKAVLLGAQGVGGGGGIEAVKAPCA